MNIGFYYHQDKGLGHAKRLFQIIKYLSLNIPEYEIKLFISGTKNKHINFEKYVDVIYLNENILKIKRYISEIDLFFIEHFPFGRKHYRKQLIDLCSYIHSQKKKIFSLVRDVIGKKLNIDQLNDDLKYFDAVFVASDENILRFENYVKLNKRSQNKLSYIGYVGEKRKLISPNIIKKNLNVKDKKIVVIHVGGGEDGYLILKKIILSKQYINKNTFFLISTGTSMSEEDYNKLNDLRKNYQNILLTKFNHNLIDYINASDLNICMGGYNSTIESVLINTITIISPRTSDDEQVIRAKAFEKNFNNIKHIDLTKLHIRKIAQIISDKLKNTNDVKKNSINLSGAKNFSLIIRNIEMSLKKSISFGKNKPNILYILRRFPEISQTFVSDEIIELINLGYDVSIISLKKPKSKKFHEKIKQYDLQNKIIYFENMEYDDIINKTLKLINEKKIDHIHCHFAYNNVELAYEINKKTNIPYTFTTHAHDIFCYIHKNFKKWADNSKKVIAISNYNKKYMVENFKISSDKIEIINCGKYVDDIIPIRKYSSDPFKIISLSRLVDKKGYPYLIQACKILKKNKIEFVCEIQGDGPQRDLLDKLINKYKLKKEIKLGNTLTSKEVLDFLENGSVFVLPCIESNDGNKDGIPNTLMEAMSKELPVISTQVTGIPELINNNNDGIIVSQKNPGELAKAIYKIKSDHIFSEKIRKNARKKIVDEFNIKKNIKKLTKLFEHQKDKKKLKIAFVVGKFPRISHTFIYNEIYYLLENNHEVLIIANSRVYEPIFEKKIMKYNLLEKTVFCNDFLEDNFKEDINFKKYEPEIKAKHIPALKKIAKLLKENNFDVIHGSFGNKPATIAMILSQLSDIPFTFETHAFDLFVDFPHAKEKCKKAKFIMTESKYNQFYLMKKYNVIPSKIKIVHLAPDKSMLDKIPKKRKKENLLVSVCRLEEIKGLEYSIKALSEIKKKYPDLKYQIIGDGGKKNDLINLVKKLKLENNVEFLGKMTNMDACKITQEASIFILPCIIGSNRDRDGTPTAIAEAMYLETPVISSDISGIPELIDNNKNGFLTESKNVNQIVLLIEKLLKNPNLRKKIGLNAKQKIINEFNILKSVKRLENLWLDNFEKAIFKKILETSPSKTNSKSQVEIHSLVCHEHKNMYLLMIKSFLNYYEDISIVVHDDGSLSNKDIIDIKTHIQGCKIINKQNSDIELYSFLENKPYSKQFREKRFITAQVFDIPFFAKKKIIIMDSDMIFLKKPKEIIEWINNENNQILHNYEKKPMSPSLNGKSIMEINTPFHFSPNLCGGFVCCYKNMFDFELIEKYCEYVIKNCDKNLYRAQTITALCSANSMYKTKILPSEYQNKSDFTDGAILRHYHYSYWGLSLEYEKDAFKIIDELKKLDSKIKNTKKI